MRVKRIGTSRWLQGGALAVMAVLGVAVFAWPSGEPRGSAQVGPTRTLTAGEFSTRQAMLEPTVSADHRDALRQVIDKHISVSDFPRSEVGFSSPSPDHVSFTEAARLASAVIIGRVEDQHVVAAKSPVEGLDAAYLLSDLRASDGTIYQLIEPIGVSRDTNGIYALGYSGCAVPLESKVDSAILVTPSSSVSGALEVIAGNAYEITAIGAAVTCAGDPSMDALPGKSASDIEGLVTAQKNDSR